MKRLKLILSMIFSIPFTILFTGMLLFLPAGDYRWVNGWMLIGSLIFYILLIFIYFIIKDPSTLERRSKLSSDKGDKLYIVLMAVDFMAILIIPTLEYRFNWTNLPFFISIIGLTGLIISYFILLFVMRENSYASKGVMIHENQKVIKTGPYSTVRHPMYLGSVIMALSIPLTLGSIMGIFPALLIPIILGNRIKYEEKFLAEKLTGYSEYTKKVTYRLIPKIW